jgi:hypothetical protein
MCSCENRPCCGCGDDFSVPESGHTCEEFYGDPYGDADPDYTHPPEDGEPMGSNDMSDDAERRDEAHALDEAGFGAQEDPCPWWDVSYEE